MKKSKNANNVFDLLQNMTRDEMAALADEIWARMNAASAPTVKEKSHCEELVVDVHPERPNCPHCGAKASLSYIVKNGMHKGAQRYKCKSCGSKFVSTTGTAFANSKKDASLWRKFIQLTISGASLHACADECGIAYQTAFTWRHKVLSVFETHQKNTKMSGKIEVDEMQIPISFKGNHIQGKFGRRVRTPGVYNDMPRKSYRRGTDNKSRHASDKACVFCMVQDGNKGFYASVPGTGFMTDQMLDDTVAKHINKESALMLADDYKITKKYFEKNGYRHMILKSNTSDNPHDHKVEVKDGLHIQHVNNMHQQIRKFLRPYCGVSSKYLSNYISLFVWLKSVGAMRQRKAAAKVSVARAADMDCYVTRKEVFNRPAIPQCA